MTMNTPDFTSLADTLTSAYSGKWDAAEEVETAGAFVQFMSSNDLIFVVLGVSLIIWFVILFFLFRIEKKLALLERRQREELESKVNHP
ncbi:MAG: hypothetical protein LC662_06540 [Rhodothermaceae bacterium]|nr:hypothetical protein [Rhodothermaceae bacterium]